MLSKKKEKKKKIESMIHLMLKYPYTPLQNQHLVYYGTFKQKIPHRGDTESFNL